MINIKPISDLRDYNKVISDVKEGSPVYLTKNGKGKYVLCDIKDFERLDAFLTILAKLKEAEENGKKNGFISSEDFWASIEKELNQ